MTEEIEQQPEHSWQRQPGESSKAFGKFCEFRDLGVERSLAKLRRNHPEEEGWSRSVIAELSERWHWQSRARAWDDEQDRVRRLAQMEAVTEMAERQAKDGLDMQRLARGAMAKWVKPDPESGQLVLATTLSPTEVVRLYRTGFEIERLARGEPTQVTEEKHAMEDEFDEERIRAGIAYALAQSRLESERMEGSSTADSLPVSPTVEPGPVAGGDAVYPQQAKPDRAASVEPDPAATVH